MISYTRLSQYDSSGSVSFNIIEMFSKQSLTLGVIIHHNDMKAMIHKDMILYWHGYFLSHVVYNMHEVCDWPYT